MSSPTACAPPGENDKNNDNDSTSQLNQFPPITSPPNEEARTESTATDSSTASQNPSSSFCVVNDNEIPSAILSPSYYYRIGMGTKGRGLFATRDIPPFTLIHEAPCILIKQSEYETHLRHTILEHYLFNCKTGDGNHRLLALGYGSLFNHDSNEPNVDYRIDVNELIIRYSTGYKSVKRGEELCIYYGNNLWFEDKDGENGDDDDKSCGESSSNNEDGLATFLNRMEL